MIEEISKRALSLHMFEVYFCQDQRFKKTDNAFPLGFR